MALKIYQLFLLSIGTMVFTLFKKIMGLALKNLVLWQLNFKGKYEKFSNFTYKFKDIHY